jgi:hypothetical protein
MLPSNSETMLPCGVPVPESLICPSGGYHAGLQKGLDQDQDTFVGNPQPHPTQNSRMRDSVETCCDSALKDPVMVPGPEGVNLRTSQSPDRKDQQHERGGLRVRVIAPEGS